MLAVWEELVLSIGSEGWSSSLGAQKVERAEEANLLRASFQL